MKHRAVLPVLAVAVCATLAAGANPGAVGRPGEDLPLMIDVAVEIVSPRDTEEPGMLSVQVMLTNLGDGPAWVPRFDATFGWYFSDYIENIAIGVGGHQDITSSPFYYSGGTETCMAWITYPGDSNHSNDTDIVIVNGTGVSDRGEMDSRVGIGLTLLPSPLAGNVVHVEYSLDRAGPASVVLFDIRGGVALRRDFDGSRRGDLPLNLSGLSGGVYFVRLDDGRSAATQKLVVQR